jgi:uncharacterized protein
MKNISFIIILVLLPGLYSNKLQAQKSGEKTVFWEISGNGLEKSSYLYGTIHLMPKEKFFSYEIVDEKLEESAQLILEMEIDVPLKEQIEWAKMMMLPPNTSLAEFVDSVKYNELKTFVLDSLKIKEMMFNTYLKFKPFAFYSALIPSIIGRKIEAYELYFSKIAKKNKIPVKGLESFEFQLGIFDSIPNEKQMEMFFDEELSKVTMKAQFDDMLDTYLSMDIYKMAESLKEEDSSYSAFEYELLGERNTNWVPLLIEYMQEAPSFIAVGAAHLAGEHGLIKQLREEGYAVSPVMLIR